MIIAQSDGMVTQIVNIVLTPEIIAIAEKYLQIANTYFGAENKGRSVSLKIILPIQTKIPPEVKNMTSGPQAEFGRKDTIVGVNTQPKCETTPSTSALTTGKTRPSNAQA